MHFLPWCCSSSSSGLHRESQLLVHNDVSPWKIHLTNKWMNVYSFTRLSHLGTCCELVKKWFWRHFFRHMECWPMSQILEAPVTATRFETRILTKVYKSYQKISVRHHVFESLACPDGIFRGSNFGLSFWYESRTRFVHWAFLLSQLLSCKDDKDKKSRFG